MEDSDQNKLFVGGISWETSDDALKDHFNKYGNVVSCVIAKDRTTGNPRGFGFVSFQDPGSVDRALNDSHEILSRLVEVKKAIPRNEQQQGQQQQSRGLNRNSRSSNRSNEHFRTKKIFVGGLSANLTEEEFKGYFEKFGIITDVVVMHDNVTHRPRGFGFISFESEDSVEEVMQKSFHELTGKLVEVKRAVPKEGNGSSNNVYNARVGGGGGSNFSNSYQHENYFPNGSRYGVLPSYGPFPGYGGVTGYPYGAGIYGGGYPSGGYGGFGYGVAPVAHRSQWNSPAIPLPFTSAPTMYPAYMNGGVGLMGVAANGYNVSFGVGQDRSGYAQGPANPVPAQIPLGNVGANSYPSGGSFGSAASKQNRRGNNERFKS